MTDASLLVRKENVTAEDRAAADRMFAEIDVLETDLARENRVAKFETEQRQTHTPPPRPNPGEGNSDARTPEQRSADQKKAFKAYVQYGMDAVNPELRKELRTNYGMGERELRDLGVGAVAGAITGGSQFVPQAFYPVLTEAKLAWGAILNEVRNVTTDDGASMKMAFANDTGNGLTVVGETVAPSELDPALATSILSTSMVTTGVIKVSIQELQDSQFDIDRFIKDNFGRRYWRGATNLVTTGGTNIQSLLSSATTGRTMLSDTAIDYLDIAALAAALDPSYEPNAKWAMNSRVRGYLLGIKDSLGRPLYVPNPTSGAFDMLLGKPVVFNQYLANLPSATGNPGIVPIQYGDFNQGYLFRTVQEPLSIIRLGERYMDQLEVGFIGYGRIGGISTDAGTHPLLNMTTP
jgi:HK97 family phage major capsid protein